jgi:hypothetical protein
MWPDRRPIAVVTCADDSKRAVHPHGYYWPDESAMDAHMRVSLHWIAEQGCQGFVWKNVEGEIDHARVGYLGTPQCSPVKHLIKGWCGLAKSLGLLAGFLLRDSWPLSMPGGHTVHWGSGDPAATMRAKIGAMRLDFGDHCRIIDYDSNVAFRSLLGYDFAPHPAAVMAEIQESWDGLLIAEFGDASYVGAVERLAYVKEDGGEDVPGLLKVLKPRDAGKAWDAKYRAEFKRDLKEGAIPLVDGMWLQNPVNETVLRYAGAVK